MSKKPARKVSKSSRLRLKRPSKMERPVTDNAHSETANDHAANYSVADYHDLQAAQLPSDLQDYGPVISKAGVRGFPRLDSAQLLLARTLIRHNVRGELLDLSAMSGLLHYLPHLRIRAVEGSAAALRVLAAQNIPHLAASVGDDLRQNWPERVEHVALVLAGDRGNAYIQAQLAWAHASTPVGAALYLAGDKDKGFDRYFKQAKNTFGAGEVIARDGGMRVAKLVRRPSPTPLLPEPQRYQAFGVEVVGLAGVFSAAKPDQATALMLRYLEEVAELAVSGKHLLDLGCGTGLIGVWAAKRGATVTLLDGDLQSVRSAKQTLAAGGLVGRVLHSDVDAALSEDERFDIILTNPPFHVGRGVVLAVALEFMQSARRRLKAGGQLYVVANAPLPYEEPLAKWGTVRQLFNEGGFKLLEVTKN